MLAAAVKAEMASAEANRQLKRAANAERQRRKRARDRDDVEDVCDVTRDVRDDALPRVTDCDTRDPSLDKEVSPKPPSRKLNPPGDISTRVRESRAELLAEARQAQQAFNIFWAIYPRKQAKPVAQKAFFKKLKEISGPDPPGVIMAGLEAHLPSWSRTESEMIPHPATWLNQDRFNDRPPPRQPRLTHDRTPVPSPAFERRQANLARAFAAPALRSGDS